MLDPKVSEALDLMQEECAEIIQVISKIRRFGLHSYNPYDSEKRTNWQLFNDEIGDFELLKRFLIDYYDMISSDLIEERIKYKTDKLVKYSKLFSD
jgi:hypothetical protein